MSPIGLAVLAACGAADEHVPARDAAWIDAATLDAPVDASRIDGPPGGVDLTLDEARMRDTVLVTEQLFAPGACEVIEGCVGAGGTRRLLRFSTVIPNLGPGDLTLGEPAGNPAYELSACHGHYHLRGFATYELVGTGGVVVAGHKQAFCLLDSLPVIPGASSRGYACGYQGISAGWADRYERELPCQWIDVTGVAPGAYTLRITVNPTGVIDETDRTNNSLELPVAL